MLNFGIGGLPPPASPGSVLRARCSAVGLSPAGRGPADRYGPTALSLPRRFACGPLPFTQPRAATPSAGSCPSALAPPPLPLRLLCPPCAAPVPCVPKTGTQGALFRDCRSLRPFSRDARNAVSCKIGERCIISIYLCEYSCNAAEITIISEGR